MPKVKPPAIEPMPLEEDKVFILTDGCMWEAIKRMAQHFHTQLKL